MARADVMAGRAYVSLYVKNDGLTRGLQKAKADLNAFGSNMLSIGSRMVAMSAAIATPFAFATKTFADFDDAMRAVGAVSQATAAQLASMTEVAKELGRTTSFTAVEVATLMGELGRAGFNSDQVNAMTGAVLNLARASGTDATLASGIMAATIRQFALEATDAARVSDVLTLAANATFNSVESLGESLKYAGPVAASLGMSLEDTVAILGTLGNVGIQGSEAGTALRRLSVISAATGKDLKEIFGISNVDAAGNLKPLAQIMGEIGVAVEKLPVAERVSKMNEAFGLLGITAATVMGKTAGDTAALAEALRKADGVAATTAANMDAGLGGAFRIIMSAAEGLQIAIGEALSGSIKNVTESITGIIGKATEWVGQNQGVIVSIAGITAAAAAAGVAIIGIGIAAKVSAVAMGVLATVFGVTKTVILSVIAVTKLWAVTSFVVGEAIYIMSSGAALLNIVAGLSASAAGIMSSAWALAGGIIGAAWTIMTAPVMPFVIAAGAAIAVLGTLAANAAYVAIRGADFSAAWKAVTSTLSDLIAVAKRVGSTLMEALGEGDYDIAFGVAMQGVKLALATAIDGMTDLWSTFWSNSWEMAKTFLSEFLKSTLNVATTIAKALANPAQAGVLLGESLGKLASTKISFSLDTDGMKSSANAELDRLEKELAARKAKREAEKKSKDEWEGLAKSGSAAAGTKPGSPGAGGDGPPAKTAFERETEALEQQIIALRQGEEAAERFRLAKEGMTEAEIERLMALREEQKALEKEQEAAQRAVRMIQEFADADYKKNKLTPEEAAKREKEAIEIARKGGQIDDRTAKEATAEADIRQAEREHKERLAKFNGEGEEGGPGSYVKSGKASAATFNLAELNSSAVGGQMRVMIDMKKAITDLSKQQKELLTAQIEATRNNGLHHA